LYKGGKEMELRVSETARLLGLCSATLRRWDRQGIYKARRTPGKQRIYDMDDIRAIEEKLLQKRRTDNE